MGWLDNYRQAPEPTELLSLLGYSGQDNPSGAIFNVMSQFLADRKQRDEEAQQQYLQQSMQQAFEDRIVERLKNEKQEEEPDDNEEPAKISKPVISPQRGAEQEEDNEEGLPEIPNVAIPNNTVTNTGTLEQQIAAKESGNNYKAFNPAGGGEGAVGKYQFRWHLWKDKIASVTGIDDKNAFLNNPPAQEAFYNWYKQHELMPAVSRIHVYNNGRYTDDQLARLVHFKGETGAKEWLTNGIDRTQANNMPIDQYLKQSGGVAITKEQQHTGLNNPVFDQLLFPMIGHNIFRGLDNGQPVLVRDSAGQSKVLHGPADTMHTYGTVKEQRLSGGWLDKYL